MDPRDESQPILSVAWRWLPSTHSCPQREHARARKRSTPAKGARPQKGARPRSQKEHARKGSTPALDTRSRAAKWLCTGSSREAARKRMESEISPELAKMGPWALGPRLGRAWAHWAHARWSKKIGIFECRGSTASFVPFPKIILSKRAYLCTKAERSHRFHILVNGCPIFVASDGSAVAQGGILRESESLSSASARRMNDMSSRWAFWDSGRNSASYGPHTHSGRKRRRL